MAILEMSLDFFNVKAHQTMCMGSWWQSRINGLLSWISLLKKLHQDTLSQSVRFHFHPFSFSILFLSFQIFQMIQMQTASIIDPPCRPRFRRVLATARWSWPPCEHGSHGSWSQIRPWFSSWSQLIFNPESQHVTTQLKLHPGHTWWSPKKKKKAYLRLVFFICRGKKIICSAAGHTPARWSSKPAPGGHAAPLGKRRTVTWTNMDQACRICIHGLFLGICLGIFLGILWTNMD